MSMLCNGFQLRLYVMHANAKSSKCEWPNNNSLSQGSDYIRVLLMVFNVHKSVKRFWPIDRCQIYFSASPTHEKLLIHSAVFNSILPFIENDIGCGVLMIEIGRDFSHGRRLRECNFVRFEIDWWDSVYACMRKHFLFFSVSMCIFIIGFHCFPSIKWYLRILAMWNWMRWGDLRFVVANFCLLFDRRLAFTLLLLSIFVGVEPGKCFKSPAKMFAGKSFSHFESAIANISSRHRT